MAPSGQNYIWKGETQNRRRVFRADGHQRVTSLKMRKQLSLTQDEFDKLLAWLDEDRDQAGKKYEVIRSRLIKIFACRGCHEAEELADITINRVASKARDIAADYSGEPALYFYGVAHKIHLEYLRSMKKPAPLPPPPAADSDEVEREYDCLEKCMQKLPSAQRELVLDYYREDRQAKIDHRKELAQKMGIALNALRIRAHRIRATLQECVQNCLEASAVG